MSKRETAIKILNENPKATFAELVTFVAKANKLPEAQAKSYIKWIVANGKTTSFGPETLKTDWAKGPAKEPKPKKEKAAKAPKTPKAPKAGRKPKFDTPEAEAIKAKNLETIKRVAEKFKAKKRGIGSYPEGKTATPHPDAVGVEGFDPDEAKREVDAIIAGEFHTDRVNPKFVDEDTDA